MLLIGSIALVGPASFDAYLPGLPELTREFGASPSAAQLTLTSFLVGLAIGPFLAGPVSDACGRRRPLLWSLGLFSLTCLICGIAPSLYVLAVMRIVQGALVAATATIARAIIRDVYTGSAAARAYSRLFIVASVASISAPIASGQLLRIASWRAVFIGLALLGLALALANSRHLPETLLRDERRGAAGISVTASTVAALLADARFSGFVLIIGFHLGALIGYLAGSPFVLQGIYGVSPAHFGLLLALNGVSIMVGATVSSFLLRTRTPTALLIVGLAMTVFASVSLLTVAVSASLELVVFIAPVVMLMFSVSLVQANSLSLALTDHPSDTAGTAVALLGAGALLSAFIAPLMGIDGANSAVPMAGIMTACALAAGFSLILVLGSGNRGAGELR
jgi:MFS transporter, DHA1 family, multidrug resistance protein